MRVLLERRNPPAKLALRWRTGRMSNCYDTSVKHAKLAPVKHNQPTILCFLIKKIHNHCRLKQLMSIQFPTSIPKEEVIKFMTLHKVKCLSMADAFYLTFITYCSLLEKYVVSHEDLHIFLASLPHTFNRSWEPIFFFPDGSRFKFNQDSKPSVMR